MIGFRGDRAEGAEPLVADDQPAQVVTRSAAEDLVVVPVQAHEPGHPARRLRPGVDGDDAVAVYEEQHTLGCGL